MKISIKHINRMLKTCFTLLYFLGVLAASAGDKRYPPAVERIDPPFWFTGMANNQVQLLIKGDNIEQSTISLNSELATIERVFPAPNKGFVFVDLSIKPNAQPGTLNLEIVHAKLGKVTYDYELKAKRYQKRGIDPNDLIYVLFPDRFANGDTTNDSSRELLEKTTDRKALKGRHGGDIQGIINHLDHLERLGTTALWINPVLINDQSYESYHGYATTDSYQIDPRLGSNELYKSLSEQCHARGIKMVMDVIYNHWGNEHILFKELPDSTWIHWFNSFTKTNYRAETLMDPYASNSDKNLMSKGWFDKHMPDLNQQNPTLANYLIQNSIWWIEYAGIDAFRIDTYSYPDQVFMKKLNNAILQEYPDFVLFGETWVQSTTVQSWFTQNSALSDPFNSELTSVTDFQLYFAITKGLMENFGWEEGFRRIEMTLGKDIAYKDPFMNVTFLDNHDLSRFYSVVNEDFDKWKMGISMMMTMRGIPSIYYGTEVLMKNYCNPDALVREDFPGGWPGDSLNLFDPAQRVGQVKEAYDYIYKLAQWRKNNPWFGRSQLMQFVPENNTYVYFRYDDGHTIMCAYSLNDKPVSLDLKRFEERIGNVKMAQSLITGKSMKLTDQLEIPAKGILILELLN